LRSVAIPRSPEAHWAGWRRGGLKKVFQQLESGFGCFAGDHYWLEFRAFPGGSRGLQIGTRTICSLQILEPPLRCAIRAFASNDHDRATLSDACGHRQLVLRNRLRRRRLAQESNNRRDPAPCIDTRREAKPFDDHMATREVDIRGRA